MHRRFSRIEEFLVRLAALLLLAISIYRLIRLDLEHPAPAPQPNRIEQRQSKPTPEESPPRSVFRIA